MTVTRQNKLYIPEAARRRHIAILGMNGSGKTSVAKAEIIEPALGAGERVCNIDPTGVGWGLRLSRSGKGEGFKIYIVGGERQDFSLEHRSGETWADIVGTSSDSFIFDTSRMTVDRRSEWFKEFAEALIITNKGPLYLVLDEAHLFAPQAGATGGGIAPLMLHSTNNLLALGRSKGLRVTMLSQRPAKLHKDALTQAHTLVAMMVTGLHDRKAVKEWIADQADEERGKEIVASLPGLTPGEGWIWAPREKMLERVKFDRPRTFDSSSAPDDEGGSAIALAPIDPATIEGKLAAVAKEKKDNDPARLRAEVVRLTAEVSTLKANATKPATPGDVDQAYRDGYTAGHAHGHDADAKRRQFFAEYSRDVLHRFATLIGEGAKAVEQLEARLLTAPDIKPLESGSPADAGPRFAPPRKAADNALAPKTASARKPPLTANGGGVHLTGPQLQLLEALAWWGRMGHEAPTRAQVAGKLGWKVKGSHLKNRTTELRNAGLVDVDSREGRIFLTAAGIASAPEPDMRTTLIDSVRSMLTGPQTQLFNLVATRPDQDLTRDWVAEQLQWDVGGSHLKNRITELAQLELIERPSKGVVRAAWWVR